MGKTVQVPEIILIERSVSGKAAGYPQNQLRLCVYPVARHEGEPVLRQPATQMICQRLTLRRHPGKQLQGILAAAGFALQAKPH